jgi:hypothetical protein
MELCSFNRIIDAAHEFVVIIQCSQFEFDSVRRKMPPLKNVEELMPTPIPSPVPSQHT